MKTVWVIEDGDYSDYRVVGVFSSKENAEKVRDAIKSGDEYGSFAGTIAEWPLDPAVAELNAGKSQWRVHMLRDGTVDRVEKAGIPRYDLAGAVSVWERTKAPAYAGKGIPDILVATVWARNEKHAIKITNEHRVQMIAAGTFE